MLYNSNQLFPVASDSDSDRVAKLSRLFAAQLSVGGKRLAITDTAVHAPFLDQDAFVIIEATADTVIASLDQVGPDGTFSTRTNVSLVSGQRIYGFYTSITLTSGSVNAYPIPSNAEAPPVPVVVGTFDPVAGVSLSISRVSGGAPTPQLTVQRKVGAGAYANLGSPVAVDVSGVTTVADASPTPASTIRYRAVFNEVYSAGVSRGRFGYFSNEYVVAVPANDATLSALVLTGAGTTLSPSFASGTHAYTSVITDGTTSVTVTPTHTEAHATIRVKVGAGAFATVASGSASAALPIAVGSNVITVRVTAQDGVTNIDYTITITRSA